MSNIIPPSTPEMEKCVICSCLIDPDAYYRVYNIISYKSFYDKRNALIFKAMGDLFLAGEPIDLVTVSEKLRSSGNLDSAGGDTYIATTSNEVATATHVEHYANQVREYAVRRGGLVLARQMEEAVSAGKTGDEVLGIAIAGIAQARQTAVDEMRVVSDVMEDEINALYERKRMMAENLTVYPQSGIGKIDRYMGFFEPGLHMIAARPNTGKTDLGLNLIYNMARRFPVGLLAAEMTQRQLISRIMCIHTTLDRFDLRVGRLPDSDYNYALEEYELGGRAKNMVIDCKSAPDIGYIRARAMAMQSVHGVRVLIIDHLHELNPGVDASNADWRRLVKGIRDIAKDLLLPVILINQLRRIDPGRRPTLDQLRQAGEEESDVVWILWRDYHDKSHDDAGNRIVSDILEIDAVKTREGPKFRVKLDYQLWNGRITERAEDVVPFDHPQLVEKDEIPF